MRARPAVIAGTVALVLLAVLAAIGAAFWDWRYGLPTHDRTTVINTVVAVGAFVLVAWGVIVALAAYVSATGSPDLSLELVFRFSFPNEPVFLVADETDYDRQKWNKEYRYVKPFRQTEGVVVITNHSKYSARNPGMRIRLEGLGGIQVQQGWETIARENMVGTMIFQWDGGADYIIHGRWSRTLPQLDVRGMYLFRSSDDPAFIVDIAADGFGPKRIRVPVKILDADEYDLYSTERNGRILRQNRIGDLSADAMIPRPPKRGLSSRARGGR